MGPLGGATGAGGDVGRHDDCVAANMPRDTSFAVVIMFASVVLLFQCKKGEEIVDRLTHYSFTTDYVVKVPPSPVTPFPVTILTPEIETSSDVAFDENHTRADLVEQIILRELSLTVQSPSGGKLSFLKSVDIHAMAEGLPEVRVAYKDLVPADVGSSLNLDVTGVELKEYFTKEKYTLRITVTTDEAVPEEYGVNAHGVFFVDAKILGQ